MIIIFEIKAHLIKKEAFYSFCVRNNIKHFKDIENTHYYARINTLETNGEASYILLRRYFFQRDITFTVFFSSMDDN